MKKVFIILGLCIILAIPVSAVNAVVPVNPEVWDDWKGADAAVECDRLGDGLYDFAVKFEYNAPDADDPNEVFSGSSKTVSGNTITITSISLDAGEPKTFNWSALPYGVGAVIVKAGTGANVWYYDPQETSDSGLYAYQNKGISHITFCWNSVQFASASADVQPCEEGDVNTPVILETEGVTMTVTHPDGQTTFVHPDPNNGPNPDTYNLPPGKYTLSYDLLQGYADPGDLPEDFTVEECKFGQEAFAKVDVQPCIEGDETEPVYIESEGVTITVTHPNGVTTFVHPDPNTGDNPATYDDLPDGTYELTYKFEDDYEDPGDLPEQFVIGVCDLPKTEEALASVQLEACSWTADDGSLTLVTITTDNAKLTINGKTYNKATTIKLPPGDYAYTWESIDKEQYTGSGKGTLQVGACVPGEEDEDDPEEVIVPEEEEVVSAAQVDPKPDVAASGEAPSLIATLTPFILAVLGTTSIWAFIKNNLLIKN